MQRFMSVSVEVETEAAANRKRDGMLAQLEQQVEQVGRYRNRP